MTDANAWLLVGTIITLLLAIVSLIAAHYQLRSMRDIAGSMTTKFVGRFPDHMPEVIRLLESAEREVTILCDLLGYGHYSSPEQCRRYRATILKLSGDVKFNIAIYSPKRADQVAQEQLGKSFEKISSSRTYNRWLEFYGISPQDAPKNIDEFYDRFKRNYDDQLQCFDMGSIEINQVDQKTIPVFFWIVDERDAVFSFPSLSIDPPEVAFKTSDRSLIEIFQRILVDVSPNARVTGRGGATGRLRGTVPTQPPAS